MTNLILNLKSLEKSSVGYFFDMLSFLEKKKYTQEQVLGTYAHGVQIMFVGDAPYNAKELNYAIFYSKVSSAKTPFSVIFKVIVSLSGHETIISKDPKNLVFAGIIMNGRFSGSSSNWIKMMPNGTPGFYLGDAVNNLFRKCYHI